MNYFVLRSQNRTIHTKNVRGLCLPTNCTKDIVTKVINETEVGNTLAVQASNGTYYEAYPDYFYPIVNSDNETNNLDLWGICTIIVLIITICTAIGITVV